MSRQRGRKREPDRDIRTDDRGQTLIDYAIAAGVFFLAIAFVVGFVPGMFVPFTGGDTGYTADRYASTLAANQLGSPGSPYVLNKTCTVAFFVQMQTDGGTPAPDTCRFDTRADSLREIFAADPGTELNVTIKALNGSVATVDEKQLTAGDPIPSSRGVTTAKRVVYFDGRTYRLLVRVW